MRFRSPRLLAPVLMALYSSLALLSACSSNSSPAAPTRPTARPTATATATATAGAPTPTPTAGVPTPTATPTATGATPTPTPAATATPTAAPTATPTAQPQIIHVGFGHAATTDPTFGVVRYYSPTSGAAAIVTVVHGSQVVFLNDDTGTPHTGSGLGTSAFPTSFDNSSGTTQSGTTIDSSLTWSTGTLLEGNMSQVFTVGAPGDYYFGCAYHYNSNGMRDVLVST
jgi:plastocyanin